MPKKITNTFTQAQKDLIVGMITARCDEALKNKLLLDTERRIIQDAYLFLGTQIEMDQPLTVKQIGIVERMVSDRDDKAAVMKGLQQNERQLLRDPLVSIMLVLNAQKAEAPDA